MFAQVERVTNHDVKAIEYVLKKRFAADAQLSQVFAAMHLILDACSALGATGHEAAAMLS